MNYSQIYQVIELNLILKNLVNQKFAETVTVLGEVSNFKHYENSGHSYFSIKDDAAQINCVYFKHYQKNQGVKLANGLSVVVTAKLSIYEKSAQAQLIVYDIEAVGIGLLQKKFEELRIRLEKQGYFNAEHKKPMPKFPVSIGIVSSPNADALKDVLTVLQRRYPIAQIYIYPSSVQGEKATFELINAINLANEHKVCDLLILTRGGGSIEDLWSFNDEKLAYSIFNSKIPIISAIGHENNYTISDYVADLRAPTPSSAAEIISKDISEVIEKIDFFKKVIKQLAIQKIQNESQQFDFLTGNIKEKIKYCLMQKKQTIVSIKIIDRAITNNLNLSILNYSKLKQKIISHSPKLKIADYFNKLDHFSYLFSLKKITNNLNKNKNNIQVQSQNIDFLIKKYFDLNSHRLKNLTVSINAKNALSEGYTLASMEGIAIKSIEKLKINDSFHLHFKDGKIKAKVLEKTKNTK